MCSNRTESQSKRPGPDTIVRPTRAGRKAQEIWRPLFGVIEERWRTRFGKEEIDQLREALWVLISQFDIELPDCLPILGYGLFSKVNPPDDDLYSGTQADGEYRTASGRGTGSVLDVSDLPLSALLSRALLAFTIEFERESPVSLAISANVLRVLDEQEVQLRDLPLLSGVSKEAISMAIGILQEKKLAEITVDPSGSRFKLARLTTKGLKAQRVYRRLLGVIEERWQERFGKDNPYNLRESLERLVGVPDGQQSPLFKGLEPYPDGWRASVRNPATLPHYPMVLHRGGFPDGS